jgi:hypothetical protein
MSKLTHTTPTGGLTAYPNLEEGGYPPVGGVCVMAGKWEVWVTALMKFGMATTDWGKCRLVCQQWSTKSPHLYLLMVKGH